MKFQKSPEKFLYVYFVPRMNMFLDKWDLKQLNNLQRKYLEDTEHSILNMLHA
jgi:hypothetical protein